MKNLKRKSEVLLLSSHSKKSKTSQQPFSWLCHKSEFNFLRESSEIKQSQRISFCPFDESTLKEKLANYSSGRIHQLNQKTIQLCKEIDVLDEVFSNQEKTFEAIINDYEALVQSTNQNEDCQLQKQIEAKNNCKEIIKLIYQNQIQIQRVQQEIDVQCLEKQKVESDIEYQNEKHFYDYNQIQSIEQQIKDKLLIKADQQNLNLDLENQIYEMQMFLQKQNQTVQNVENDIQSQLQVITVLIQNRPKNQKKLKKTKSIRKKIAAKFSQNQ